jgi:hypothetical protein
MRGAQPRASPGFRLGDPWGSALAPIAAPPFSASWFYAPGQRRARMVSITAWGATSRR